MSGLSIIETKKRGGEHDAAELEALVAGMMDGSIPDYQLAAWLMAVWQRGMNAEETWLLTDAMRRSGEEIQYPAGSRPTADKHSTGGVGDKVSLILAPLAAELGMRVPMLAGRGLGHTGGTIDKLLAIPGFRSDLTPKEMLALVEEVGCVIGAQTEAIAPADRVLYHLRDVTATVDCMPLIISSILSKKFAAGPESIVIDLKCGSGAFMQTLEEATALANGMLEVSRRAGRVFGALITDMDQPLGQAVGHALEVEESLELLQGKGPARVRTLIIELVVAMGQLAGVADRDSLGERCEAALDDGSALRRFLRMATAQGASGGPDQLPELEIAPEQEPLRARRGGYVGPMACASIGRALEELSAARRTREDQLDLGTGLRMLVEVGDKVEAGMPLVRIFARDEATASKCRTRVEAAMELVDEDPGALPLIRSRIGFEN